MTIYISQGRYTPAAIRAMTAKPESRSEAIAEMLAAAGGRLIGWYLTSPSLSPVARHQGAERRPAEHKQPCAGRHARLRPPPARRPRLLFPQYAEIGHGHAEPLCRDHGPGGHAGR